MEADRVSNVHSQLLDSDIGAVSLLKGEFVNADAASRRVPPSATRLAIPETCPPGEGEHFVPNADAGCRLVMPSAGVYLLTCLLLLVRLAA